nr:S-layer homology domain-containing protein [Bacillota bacterium]
PTPTPTPATDDSSDNSIPSVNVTDNTGTIASGDTTTGGTTTTTTNNDGSTTTTTTTENTTTTTTTKENADGSTTTTATQTSEKTNSDGSTTKTETNAESKTTTSANGSTTTTATQTSTSTTTGQDGSSVTTETKKDVTTTTNTDGSSTSTVKEESNSTDGSTKTTETSKTTDSDGNTSTKTAETSTQTKQTADGGTVTTNTTSETSSSTDASTGVTSVTKSETTETTTKAKNGTATKTTTTTESSKTTDVNNGTSSSTITATTTSQDGTEKTVTETKNDIADGVLTSTTAETVTKTNEVSGDTSRTTTSTNTKVETVTKTATVKEEIIEKPGFVAAGWSDKPYSAGDPNYDGETTLEIPVTEKTVETTTYLADENGDIVTDENGEPVVVSTETVTTVERPAIYASYVNVTVPSALEPEADEDGNYDHKVYIYGYPDGEVKPNNNITREEITAAFDRLLNVAFRANIVTTEQDFPDVNNDRWSNESIATMANGGFIVGDENGNFNPSKPITRAEFAVIAAKFAPIDAEIAENYFTDIEGHWAKDFILKIAGQYWISGNPDGSFNPDAPITRAEAMTIINRMLVRYGDEGSDYATQWPDVDKSDWYYDPVIEATTHNTFVRTENGWSEKWIEE